MTGTHHETTPPSWWGKRLRRLTRERRGQTGSGGEDSGRSEAEAEAAQARLGLAHQAVVVHEGQQVLGTCSPELLTNLKAALRELFQPEPIPDEQQTFDEQVRVRTAWVRRHAHPDTCNGTDNCGCAT